MNPTTTAFPALPLALSLAAALLAGCASGTKSTLPAIERYPAIVQAEMTCPISGETVTACDEAAYFESFPVYCKGRANARQFASLEMKQRARLASDQVLPQKGIANRTCPLTGDTLTAAAAPVAYEGAVIGFASAADANQFRSLKAERKARLIEAWRADEADETEQG